MTLVERLRYEAANREDTLLREAADRIEEAAHLLERFHDHDRDSRSRMCSICEWLTRDNTAFRGSEEGQK